MKKLAYQLYKLLIYIPLFFLDTALAALGCLLISPFSQRLASRWMGKLWSRFNFAITPASVVVEGAENADDSQVYVVVSNHLSQYDIFVVYGWLGLDLKWVMKKELRKVPFIGIASAAMGYVFLDRRNRVESMKILHDLKDNLSPGMSLMFFPEGTRSIDGGLKPFKTGAFSTAKDLDVAILPVSIAGTDKIRPSGTFDLHPGVARLVIHPAIPVADVRTATARELANRAKATIDGALNQDPLPADADKQSS